MKTKHESILEQLSATFRKDIVKKWEASVMQWEADPTTPNPYEEPDTGV